MGTHENTIYLQRVAEEALDRSRSSSHIPVVKPVSIVKNPEGFQKSLLPRRSPMEWIDVGTTGGFLMGALAVMAAGGFMFFLGKNME